MLLWLISEVGVSNQNKKKYNFKTAISLEKTFICKWRGYRNKIRKDEIKKEVKGRDGVRGQTEQQ